MEDITVRSQIGKTNFSVDVNYESDVVCKMKGRWIQVPLLDNLNTMKPISATRIAPTFRMRNMTDAIRSISIVPSTERNASQQSHACVCVFLL
jgi:hypothetical protein